MKIWQIKKGSDGKIRSRHPWIFSNELMFSPKGILPGDPIEIQDEKGNFIARGYGNPNSQIAFRALSFEKKIENPCDSKWIIEKIVRAWKARLDRGFRASYRIVFSETDDLPGLILDHYLLESGSCLSVQINTAGMEQIFKSQSQPNGFNLDILKSAAVLVFGEPAWEKTTVIVKNTSSGRKLEGLTIESAIVLKDPFDLKSNPKWTVQLEDLNPESSSTSSSSAANPAKLLIKCDLINGQKTGLFLDQSMNIKLVLQALHSKLGSTPNQSVRILDLCCYMGQWSTYLARYLLQAGHSVEVVLVDVSDLALEMAKSNIESLRTNIQSGSLKVTVIKCDALDVSDSVKEQIGFNSSDVVISDPPAFVKNKKSIETGLHGYMKLNELAFKWAKPNALVASCTCSGLIELKDFKASLKKALLRSGKFGQVVAIGGQGADHPQNIHFPEGEYLKMVLHHLY